MQLKEIIQRTTEFFKNKGIESARLDAELLIASVLKLDRVGLYLKFDYPLKESELDACRELVKRRAAGEPVAYILGKKDFFKSTFVVNRSVLIPRPETEELVEAVLKFASLENVERVIDLGTGSGCIGLSIIKEINSARLLAIDLSKEALQVAYENSKNLALDHRSLFLMKDAGELSQDDAIKALNGVADVVVANPPYVSIDDLNVSKEVREFEPAAALFAKENGLQEIERWSAASDKMARSGALVMFEIGHTQGQKAKEIFSSLKSFEKVEIVKDLSGKDRFVKALKI